MTEIELMQLTTAEILQIDATIITGILILLTLARNTLTRPIRTETGTPYTKTTMKLPAFVALVVVPFSISALTILFQLFIFSSEQSTNMDTFTNLTYQLSLGMMIVGFLYIIAVIVGMTRQKLI